MAGRRGHIGVDSFTEFIDGLPDDQKGQGYFLIKREYKNPAGGTLQNHIAHIAFDPSESYESVKARIKEIALTKGPGTYFAIPCNQHKQVLKGVDMVKFTFDEKEVPMSNGDTASNGGSVTDPMKDTLNLVKKTHKDINEIRAMKLQERMMDNLLGKDENEEDDVKEAPGLMGGGMENFMLYKSLFEDKKDNSSDLKANVARLEAKLEAQAAQKNGNSEVSELRDLVKDLIRGQQAPKQDAEVKELLRHMIEKDGQKEKESTLQTMFAMQVKAQEERDRARETQEIARREEAKAERQKQDEERRDERRQTESKAALDLEKFKAELSERDRRFTAELEIRKAELNAAKESSKGVLSEQQTMQLKFFELMKNGKDSNFEMMKDVFGIMSSSGLNSMKTAQQAADAIISITERLKDGKDSDEKPSGLESIMKGLGALAGPLMAPYLGADAQSRMIQGLAGNGGIERLLAGLNQGAMPVQRTAQRPVNVVDAPVSGPSPAPKASKDGGAAVIIVQFLSKYPEVKYALIGNIQEKLGVDMFLPILLDVNQPALEALIANIPAPILMAAVKQACTPEEKKIIDENPQWFLDLKRAMIAELRAEAEEGDDEEEGEEVEDDGNGKAIPTPPPKAVQPPVKEAPPATQGEPVKAPQ